MVIIPTGVHLVVNVRVHKVWLKGSLQQLYCQLSQNICCGNSSVLLFPFIEMFSLIHLI